GVLRAARPRRSGRGRADDQGVGVRAGVRAVARPRRAGGGAVAAGAGGAMSTAPPPERVPAIKVLLLPKDTNALGTIFGGGLRAHVDLAPAGEARKVAAHRYVTRYMREVEFHEPVFVGDVVNFFTETMRVGRTSITVKVTVEAERWGAGHRGDKVM